MTPATDRGWPRVDRIGDAQVLHDLDLPPRRGVWVFTVERPTIVLGSTQSADVLDADRLERSGVAVARRRSGGGLVGLVPGGSRWVDVVIPRGDELWAADIGRSFLWVGERWQEAAATQGLTSEVVAAPDRGRPWSELVCFAGHNTGELVRGGAKVVGLSQRRTREMARYQCLVLADPSLDLVVEHVALAPSLRTRLRHDATAMTATVPDPDAVVDSFVNALP